MALTEEFCKKLVDTVKEDTSKLAPNDAVFLMTEIRMVFNECLAEGGDVRDYLQKFMKDDKWKYGFERDPKYAANINYDQVEDKELDQMIHVHEVRDKLLMQVRCEILEQSLNENRISIEDIETMMILWKDYNSEAFTQLLKDVINKEEKGRQDDLLLRVVPFIQAGYNVKSSEQLWKDSNTVELNFDEKYIKIKSYFDVDNCVDDKVIDVKIESLLQSIHALEIDVSFIVDALMIGNSITMSSKIISKPLELSAEEGECSDILILKKAIFRKLKNWVKEETRDYRL